MTATAPPPAAPAAEASRWQRVAGPAVTIGGLGARHPRAAPARPARERLLGLLPQRGAGHLLPGLWRPARGQRPDRRRRCVAAASSNLLFVVLLPLLVFLLGRWAYERWTGRVRQPNGRRVQTFLIALGVAAVVFTVLRNLEIGAWLAP